MAYVVTENCKDCRFTDCVAACPVDCFHADGLMLYIDPEECIDCGACVPACPVSAIFEADELPENLLHWEKINAERSQTDDTYNITSQETPLSTAGAKRDSILASIKEMGK